MITIHFINAQGERDIAIFYAGMTTAVEADGRGGMSQVVRDGCGEIVGRFIAGLVTKVFKTPAVAFLRPFPRNTKTPWRFTNMLKTRIGTDERVTAWCEHPDEEGDTWRDHTEAQQNAIMILRAVNMHVDLLGIAYESLNLHTHLAMHSNSPDERAASKERERQIRAFLFWDGGAHD